MAGARNLLMESLDRAIKEIREGYTPKSTKLSDEAASREENLWRLEEETGMSQEERLEEFGPRMWHATDVATIGEDGVNNFRIGSHFGSTPESAAQRIKTRAKNGDISGPPTTYAVRIDVRNPFDIPDKGQQHSALDIADEMVDEGVIDPERYAEIWDMVGDVDMDSGRIDDQAAWEMIRDDLEEAGFDGIAYTNMVEDSGSEVLMPLRDYQIRSEAAAVDPAKMDSGNMLASVGAGTLATGAAVGASVAPSQAEASETGDPILDNLNASLSTGKHTPDPMLQYLNGSAPKPDAGAVAEHQAATAPDNKLDGYNTVRGAIQQYIRGATFGAADEVVGATRAWIDNQIDNLAGVGDDHPLFKDGDVRIEKPSFSTTMGMFIDDERANRDAFVEENPATAIALEILGGVATGGASAKAVAMLAPAAKLGVVGATTAAIDGAVYGYLDSDGGVADAERFRGALLGGAMGGVLGGAIGGVMQRHASKKSAAAADVVDHYIDNLTIARSQGLDGEAAKAAALSQTRVTADEFMEARRLVKIADPKIPSKAAADAAAPGLLQAREGSAQSAATWLEKAKGSVVGKAANYTINKAHDRISAISPRLAGATRKMEMKTHARTQEYMEGVKDWEKVVKNMDKGTRQVVHRLLLNGETGAVYKSLAPEQRQALSKARTVLKKIKTESKAVGYDFPDNDTYWPRVVKDYDGLVQQLGREQKTELQRELAKAAKATKKGKLNEEAKAKIVSRFMRRTTPTDPGMPHAKARTINTISTEMMPFYSDSSDSLVGYIHRMAGDIEMKRFFNESASGSTLKKFIAERGGAGGIDDDSLVEDAVSLLMEKEGLIGSRGEKDIRSILTSRFTTGRRGMSTGMKTAKDVGAVSALGNFASTITQFGDLANAVKFNGWGATVKSLYSAARDTGDIPLKALGLDNTLTQDLSTAEGLTKWVDGTLTATGFKAMDRFGKRVIVEGAFKKAQQQAKSPKGVKALEQRWKGVFGDNDFAILVDDLRNGRVTENTKLLTFNVVSDAQPVSLIEMPQAYLDAPNGRIMYTLKSYAINQLNILKNAAFDPKQTGGSKVKALAGVSNFLMLTGLMNGGVQEFKGLLKGDDFHAEDIPDNSIDALLGMTIVYNRYTSERFYERGDYKLGILNALAPPMPTGVRNVPLIGQIVEDWMLGGAEKRKDRRADEKGEDVDTNGFGGEGFGSGFGSGFDSEGF